MQQLVPLIWKEWHEHSWKLGFGCLVLGAIAWIGLRSRILSDEETNQIVCFIGFILLPTVTSGGLIPAERGDRSLMSTMALPISARRVAAIKLVVGFVLCGLPIVLAGVISLLLSANRELPAWAIIELYARSTFTALSLLVWMQALTIRLPTEARAALLSIGILVLWMLLSGAFEVMRAPMVVHALSPFSFIYGVENTNMTNPSVWLSLLVQLVLGWGLFKWSSRSLEFDSGR